MCLTRKKIKDKKKIKSNKVVPLPQKPTYGRVDAEYIERFRKEILFCGGCNKRFAVGTNKIKIHCNSCEKFFHCNIAGQCIGDDCKIIKEDGTIHRASYCNDCVISKYGENCLCKDCGIIK
mgnify:FL=1|jgi:hypothetical protein|tara:strand:- start:44 stop:406 length:363 start_codon:yes stop_codon:yes gene_type:complete